MYEKADHTKEHMGLSTWKNAPGGKIVKTDALFAYATMVVYCALRIFLILCDTNIALPKLSAPVAIAILILGAICAISAVAHCVKRESMQAYKQKCNCSNCIRNNLFFTATMDTFSKFFEDSKMFLRLWLLLFTIIIAAWGGMLVIIAQVGSNRLVRCKRLCNLTKEIILFDKSLEQEGEEPVRYTSHTDNLILFLKRIMQNLLEKVKQIYSCRKSMK